MPGFGELLAPKETWSAVGAVQAVRRDERGVEVELGGPLLWVSVLAPNMVRVRLAPAGSFRPHRSWAVVSEDAAWPVPQLEARETDTAVEIETERMRVQIRRDPCRVVCFDKAGRPFAEDTQEGAVWLGETVAGSKRIESDEHFYGFGERTGFLDKLAEVKTNWTVDAYDFGALTDNMYQAIPFFIALRPQLAYGVFFNTTFRSRFDLGASQPGVWRMETHGGELDYYVIYGPTPAEIVRTYADLTGHMPLPPRWALGYQQCRWSYESEEIVRDLARQFRERRIPCDVIHFDIDYMRGYRVFTWSPKRFPDPAKLVGDLRNAGFKVVTIIDPGVKAEPEADYAAFDAGVAHDYFIRRPDGRIFHGYVWPDRSVFPDFLRPDVRQWWSEQHRGLVDAGVSGIWNDMNEPAIHARPFGDGNDLVDIPLDAPQGPPEERATHAEAHNLYGLGMARAAREALDRMRSGERSFILTRSGYAGIQRWSAVWMGDNQSLWEYLETSLPMLCNMGLSGVPFVGADIGGFARNATAEMFARWMQAGLLYPFMRGHSALGTEQHEPWAFGEQTERICREYIELRYRLLPYIYTLFWQAAATGAPVLRPLVYEFPDDSQTYALYDQVLLGPALLAAPVYRPGVDHRAVYLPAGTWYDWWSGARHAGPTTILADAPLERMPLYARAGSAIPMGPAMQYSDERPLDELRVRVWPGEGSFTLYEDDGHTFAHRDGDYATTTYNVKQDGEQTSVEIGAREGRWKPAPRTTIVEVAGRGEQRFEDDGSGRRLTF